MRILVRRIASSKRDAFEYQDAEYVRDAISIGSSSKSTLLLEGAEVLATHAVLSRRRDGQIQIKADSGAEIALNGTQQRRSVLKQGDRIGIGGHELRVIEKPLGFDIAFALIEDTSSHLAKSPQGIELEFPLDALSLKGSGINIRRWSWLLMLLVLALGLIFPLLANYSDDTNNQLKGALPITDSFWLSGPLHSVHRTPELGNNCVACHESAFVSVEDKACIRCHEAPDHTLRQGHEETFSGLNCINCHKEHNEPAHLTRTDEQLCVDCHYNLPTRTTSAIQLSNVAGFDAHPEFKVSLLTLEASEWIRKRHSIAEADLTEQSNLLFSHLQHMNPDGIDGPQGLRSLVCGDCHQAEQNGKLMKPITMEQHCASCHNLAFEPTDPERHVPHAEPRQVLRALEEYYARLYAIRGGPVTSTHEPSRPAKRPGKPPKRFYAEMQAWADDKAFAAAKTLMEESACSSCHDVSVDTTKTGADRWSVVPVKLNNTWMPKATFDHEAHTAMECAQCHQAVESEQSGDVLMPALGVCKECHGGEDSKMMVSTGCVGCHSYHLKP